MTNLYEGKPDGRQSASMTQPVSRFRPVYRALSDEEKAHHDKIKEKAAELEALIMGVKAGRYQSLALTSLEESVIWAIKELTGGGLWTPQPPDTHGHMKAAAELSYHSLQMQLGELRSELANVKAILDQSALAASET